MKQQFLTPICFSRHEESNDASSNLKIQTENFHKSMLYYIFTADSRFVWGPLPLVATRYDQ